MTTVPGAQELSEESALAAIAAAAAKDAGLGDAELLGDFLPVLLAAVTAGNRLSRRNLASFRDAGRKAAARGIALRPVLDLFLSAAWRLWSRLPPVAQATVDPPAVVRAGELMLRAADDVVGALTEGYQLARRQLVAAQAAARREFVDDLLLGGTQGLAGLVERAASFGLTLAGPHAVVVVEAEQPFTDSAPLTAMLERSILGSKADADALVTTKEGSLVVIFAAPDRGAVEQVVTGLTGSLPAIGGTGVQLRRTAQVGDWRIGVGRPHQGPGGVRLSYEQAREALRLGGRLGGSGRVFDAADFMVQRVLVRDEEAMRELVDAVLTPLTGARGGAEQLLQTLEAYFAAGGNASLGARSLHLSVRAFTYRLERVAQLTGRDPVDPAQRFELQTAVTGARLLGWPDRR
ncbi:PucR family transcriptional regulator [Nakamurella sp. GG22]